MLLAIDTSSDRCLVCLGDDEQLIAASVLQTTRGHSAHLLGLVQEILKRRGISLQSLSGIAATQGPGSYTGLRIGLTAAVTLAYAAGVPFYGLPTLACHAWMWSEWEGTICPLLDARNERVYTALFTLLDTAAAPAAQSGQDHGPADKRSSHRTFTTLRGSVADARSSTGNTRRRELVELSPAQAISLSDWLKSLAQDVSLATPILFTGNGTASYRGLLDEWQADRMSRDGSHEKLIYYGEAALTAEGLWRAAAAAKRKGDATDPKLLQAVRPMYLGEAVRR